MAPQTQYASDGDKVDSMALREEVSPWQMLAGETAPGTIDYADDSDFCLDDFVDFEAGEAGRCAAGQTRKRVPTARESRRRHPATRAGLLEADDEEMVLPPDFQPVMVSQSSNATQRPLSQPTHAQNSYQFRQCELNVPTRLDQPLNVCDGVRKPDLNDETTRRLYDQLLLFSQSAQTGRMLVFENCDAATELTLHALARTMFNFDYSFDSNSCRARISRPGLPSGTSGLDSPANDPSRDSKHDSHDQASLRLPIRTAILQPGDLSIATIPSMSSPPLAVAEPMHISSFSAAAFDRPGVNSCTFHPSPIGTTNRSGGTLQRRVGYPARGGKKSLGQKLHSWTSKTLSILHEEGHESRAAKRRALFSKSLEDLGGPCWRCMIRGLSCDSSELTCRNCPGASLKEDFALWPLVGCRRGHLSQTMPPPNLCPGVRISSCDQSIPGHGGRWTPESVFREREEAANCLRRAEGQRLQDSKAIFGEVLSEPETANSSLDARLVFIDIIKNRKYRESIPLRRRYWSHDVSYTYAELITSIAWELMDNRSACSDLEIECVENFIQLLEVSSSCEGEFSSTWLVFLSMICLKDCLDALRLVSTGFLSPSTHRFCAGKCQVETIQLLGQRMEDYVNELSRVLFKSERRDKHCWLSIFFSLHIQSFFRHGLAVLEKQLNPPDLEDNFPDRHLVSTYLHLAATLFGAASDSFDPIFSYFSAEPRSSSPIPEHLEVYVSQARAICLIEASYFETPVSTSFEFLRRTLQIAAPDFDQNEQFTDLLDDWGESLDDAPLGLIDMDRPGNVSAQGFVFGADDGLSFTRKNDLDDATRRRSTSIFSASLASGKSTESLPTTIEPSIFSFEVQSPVAASFIDYASTCSIASSQDVKPAMQAVRPYMKVVPPNYANRPLPDLPTKRSPSPVAMVDDDSFICDCCPKRPKAFTTAEELAAHTRRKPHVCDVCGSRSKNLNEARRHFTAVHLKPFSWSCQKLGNLPLSAFQVDLSADIVTQTAEKEHPNTENGRPSTPTVLCYMCGFCGKTYRRKALAPLMVGERLGELEEHVRKQHHFSLCASDKKFFRDDHFSQHLKNVHAAVAGQWLKTLMESCKSVEAEMSS